MTGPCMDVSETCSTRSRLRLIYAFDLAVLSYFLVGFGLSRIYGFVFNIGLVFDFRYAPVFVLALVQFLALYAIFRGFWLFFKKLDKEIFGPVWRKELRHEYASPQRILDLLHVFIALQLMLSVHAIIKQAIFLINPRLYDEWLEAVDVVLHAGYNPAFLAREYFSAPWLGAFIDSSYLFWYQTQLPCFAIFILTRNRKLFESFFLAYFGLWLIGGLLALLIPSWGPIYYRPELFSGLHKPHADVLQAKLWTDNLLFLQNPSLFKAQSFEGIAAFPSLHVGVVALFSFFLFRVHWGFGMLMGAYALLVQLGSVVLGWHYAIDGYFSALLAVILGRIAMTAVLRPNASNQT